MAKQSEPWNRSNPRKKAGKPSKHLGTKGKTKAKSIAKAHGRSRPSLVDNMNALKGRGGTKKASTKKKTATKKKTKTAVKKRKAATKRKTAKSSTRKTSAKKSRPTPRARSTSGARTKDPRGGLTAAGRAEFARTQGSHLKPGVTKSLSEMTPDEMRRKGSWAVRFYGRHPLPPLIDKKGEPTRLALSAHAWGEPVPKTEAAARKIADKGHKLLARYHKLKES